MILQDVLVLFDWHGTIVESMQTGYWGLSQVFAKHDMAQPCPQKYRDLDGLPLRDIVNRLLPPSHAHLESVVLSQISELIQSESFNAETAMPPITAIDGMLDVITELKGLGAKCGLVTNHCADFLSNCDFRMVPQLGPHLYEAIVTGSDLSKPDPRTIYLAAKRADFAHGKIIFVGDTATDVGTARAACVPSIGVAWGSDGKCKKCIGLEIANADVVLTSPDELSRAIQQLAAVAPALDWQKRYDASSFGTGKIGGEPRRGAGGGGGGLPGRRDHFAP